MAHNMQPLKLCFILYCYMLRVEPAKRRNNANARPICNATQQSSTTLLHTQQCTSRETFSIVTSCYSSWREIAREEPVDGVSCGACELLQEVKKEIDRRD
jgi:hypothetical protein